MQSHSLYLYTLLGQKLVETWPSQLYVGLPQNVATKLEAHDYLDCFYIKIPLHWNSQAPNLFQHDKARAIKTWSSASVLDLANAPVAE